MKIKKLLLILSISLSSSSCRNETNQITNANTSMRTDLDKNALSDFKLPRLASNFPEYIKNLQRFAKENGIKPKTIDEAFADVYYLERAIAADKNQPEKKLNLTQYLAIVASPHQLALAKKKMDEYRLQANVAANSTNVSAEYIIALWGIESRYGMNQGKKDVISALSTLAFEGRREMFFSKELIQALKILERGDITKEKFKGSWAGAMGQCQFMPSSLLAYGKDGDGDGKVDIWNNVDDVFASIGNYLARNGWNKNINYWGNKVVLPDNFNTTLIGFNRNQSKSIADWQQLKIEFDDLKTKPANNTLAWLIQPNESKKTERYLVYSNFKTIMNWNRSYFFAISVGTIADSLMEK
uniref:Lytic murein transglycosylase n=1 Tax=Planococcus citri TaxID=170843 RepID=S5NZS6_9HEMI|nr:lytic murein transglycosylase [Planococcus citri]